MANSKLTWNDVTSQVDSYSDAGKLGVLTATGLGQTFANAGKAFSDMYSEAAAQDALQYLAQVYDPNNMQSINQAMPLALASNPGMSSEMLKYLTGAGRTLMNTQLDADNLNIEKDRVKAAQNAIDMAIANADVKGTRAANEVMRALNARADARTYGNVDPLLTSQAQRANIAADTAVKRAQQATLANAQRVSGAAQSIAQALVNYGSDIDRSTREGQEAYMSLAQSFAKDLSGIDGVTEADAYSAMIKGMEMADNMIKLGAVSSSSNMPLAGNLTGSFLDPLTLQEKTFSWGYDLNPIVPNPAAQTIVEQALGQRASPTAIPNVAATRAQLKEQEQIAKAAQTINNVMAMGRTGTAIPYQTPSVGNLANTYAQASSINLPTAEQANAAIAANAATRAARLQAAEDIEENQTMSLILAAMADSSISSPSHTSHSVSRYNEKALQLVEQVRKGEAITSDQAKTLDPAQKQLVKAAQEQASIQEAQQDINSVTDAVVNVRDSFASPDISPQAVHSRNSAFSRLRKEVTQANNSAKAAVSQYLSTDIDRVNTAKTADTTYAAFNALYGVNPLDFPTDGLGLKDDSGKALTKEEILSLDENEYFDAFANGKDWSSTEKGTARQIYTDLLDNYFKSVTNNPVISRALAISILSDFNEHNSGLTRLLGDNEDFIANRIEIFDLAEKVRNTLIDSNSEMYNLLLQLRDNNRLLAKMEESKKSFDTNSDALYRSQVNQEITGISTLGKAIETQKRVRNMRASQQLGFDTADAYLRNLVTPR